LKPGVIFQTNQNHDPGVASALLFEQQKFKQRQL